MLRGMTWLDIETVDKKILSESKRILPRKEKLVMDRKNSC